jgi:hypothetical protein
MRGRFSPGLITAIVLFFPATLAVWLRAKSDGVVDLETGMLAIGGGALLMAYPIVMLNMKGKPYFKQA